MTEQAPLNDQDREELTAYLDGELDEERARAIEARLNIDPRARAEVDSLRSAWDLLDYLPRPEPSSTFTHRTLELATRHRSTHRLRRPTWRAVALGAGWAAAVLIAGLIGYGSMSVVSSRWPTDEDLARDLRIIEHRRLYEPVYDIDFLRKLSHPDLFGDDGLDS